MKKSNISILIIFIFSLSCSKANISYKEIEENFKYYEKITENYKINNQWWKEYNDNELNEMIEITLTNNKDLLKSRNTS